ncbi:MAG: hypothetical protein AAFQ79_09175 [Pseudomonadota bacterium]
MIIGSRYEIATANPFRGGMSEVHIATDRHLDRSVVLKCLQPFQDPQRIVDEQKALQEVTSKHVVQLLDVVKQDFAGSLQTFLVI